MEPSKTAQKVGKHAFLRPVAPGGCSTLVRSPFSAREFEFKRIQITAAVSEGTLSQIK